MKLSYQVAMPDVPRSPMITSYQGDLEEGFRLLQENGYAAVELMVLDTDTPTVRAIPGLLSRHHLALAMVATGELYGQARLSLSSTDSAVRAECLRRCKRFIDLAGACGSQMNIGRVRGLYEENTPREVTWQLAIDAFKELADYAAPRNVTIALEPVNLLQANFVNSTAEGREVVDTVGRANFRIMLDLFHMNIQDKDLINEIAISTGYFSYVHVTDNNRLYPGNCGFDFPAIVKAITDTGYDGVIGVEIMQVPDSATAIRESARTLLPLMGG